MVEPLPEIEKFYMAGPERPSRDVFFVQKYILSVESFELRILYGLQFLRNEVIGPKIKYESKKPNEDTHKPDNGIKSMKKCSHLLFDKATPKTWDQNLFAITME